MSKECMRKFGVKRISRFNLDLICKDCGKRAGLHHNIIGDERCPTINAQTGKPFEKEATK